MANTPTARPALNAALADFDILPDSAHVRIGVVAALFGIGVPTVWRWLRAGQLPQPVRRGGTTTWRVGDLRRVLSTDTQAPRHHAGALPHAAHRASRADNALAGRAAQLKKAGTARAKNEAAAPAHAE